MTKGIVCCRCGEVFIVAHIVNWIYEDVCDRCLSLAARRNKTNPLIDRDDAKAEFRRQCMEDKEKDYRP